MHTCENGGSVKSLASFLHTPQTPCHSECPPPLHLLCPFGTSSSFLCPGHDLPGSLSSSPHVWLLGRQGSATSRLGSDGGNIPHSQIKMEEGLLGDSGKAADLQVGELRPGRAQALSRVTQQELPCPSSKLSLCAIK